MNQNKLKPLSCLAGLLLLAAPSAHAQRAQMKVDATAGRLNCSITFDGKPVIGTGELGLEIDRRKLGENAAIEAVNKQKDGTTYVISRTDGTKFEIETRCFDDGVAFRYRYPTDGPCCVYTEQTSLTFPASTKVWYASGPFQYGWHQQYQERAAEHLNGELLAPPSTFQLPDGTYAALTEANLRGFHGAVLFGREGGRIQFGYVENEGHLKTDRITGVPPGRYMHSVVRNVPWIAAPNDAAGKALLSPWRVLMLASDLNGLVNNQILKAVSDLPDPNLFPQGAEEPWIKPGRSVFTWLTEEPNRLSVANHKRYVDGAAELGLQSVVVDDGWEHWGQTEPDAKGRSKWDFLKELTDYARAKNVDIWVWRPSSPRWGNAKDEGLVEAGEREAFMKKCAETGVKGLKIDFFHTENLFTVNLMEDILKSAARHHLMVVFHGVNKPTGDFYTWPNLMAKEAVRGLECVGGENSWAPGPPWPYHNTVLPFTRWLVGAADYTPLNFRRFCPPSITFGHQLATICAFTSPMLILAADMEDMLNCPARSFIEEMPVEWDETRVLKESRIGELAALARRKGDVWYLAVLNGETAGKKRLTLDFLRRGDYRITFAGDNGKERRKLKLWKKDVKSGAKLNMELLSGGGFLAKIEKI